MFGFEKLEVYQVAVELLLVAARIIDQLPRGYSAIADQLKRASLSIATNIAEGAGRLTEPDQRRHYGISRGSAMECAALLVACEKLAVGEQDAVRQGRPLLLRIVSMLTKMCRR